MILQNINAQVLCDTTYSGSQTNSSTVSDSSLTTVSTEHSSVKWYSMFTDVPLDCYNFGKEIFKSSNIPTVVGLTALTGFFIYTDGSTAHQFHRYYRESPKFRDLNDGVAFLGDGRFHFILAAAMGATGFFVDNSQMLRCATQLVEAELATGLTVQILKHITGKESPQAASAPRGRYRFFPSIKQYHENQQKYYSFPSGHVSTTMAAVTVIAENFPDQHWIRPVGYAAVGLIGISLVNKGWHWYSDFPLAVAIGYVFGKVISHKDEQEAAPKNEEGVSFHPTFFDGPGIGITYRFK